MELKSSMVEMGPTSSVRTKSKTPTRAKEVGEFDDDVREVEEALVTPSPPTRAIPTQGGHQSRPPRPGHQSRPPLVALIDEVAATTGRGEWAASRGASAQADGGVASRHPPVPRQSRRLSPTRH